MMGFSIVSDSSCDLPGDWTKEAGVSVVPFYVSLDGEEYLQEGRQITVTDFYREMQARPDCFPKTSMPSVRDYMNAFLPAVRKGLPVLCICLTRNFSGSMEAALNARAAILEEFGEAEIEVMDSRLVTGLPVPEYGAFRKDLWEKLKAGDNLPADWDEIQIGATIGVHTGPYPVGAGFLRKWTPEELNQAQKGTVSAVRQPHLQKY